MSGNRNGLRFSVIVPVYEQWNLVSSLLCCLGAQAYSEELFEILLVDNGSNDFCPPDSVSPNVRIFKCDVRGSYAARNHGIAHARGEWLVFTDADCLPDENWLAEMAGAIQSGGVCKNLLIAGSVEVVGEARHPSVYEVYDMVRGIPQALYVSRGYAATANLAAPRELIDKLGGFNHKLYSGGDADFCRRALSVGCDIKYVAAAKVRHRVRANWESVATKARRVKGGQLTCKSGWYKGWIFARTFISPFITLYRLGLRSECSRRHRAIAICVYFRVWVVEIRELFRVAFGGEPERR